MAIVQAYIIKKAFGDEHVGRVLVRNPIYNLWYIAATPILSTIYFHCTDNYINFLYMRGDIEPVALEDLYWTHEHLLKDTWEDLFLKCTKYYFENFEDL